MPTTTPPRALTLYADPGRCPACRTLLTAQPCRCPDCGVDLDVEATTRVRHALAHVDRLVLDLARARVARPQPLPEQVPEPRPGPAHDPAPLPTYPRTSDPHRPRRLRATSVPGMLLGLGAVCLLVAAVTFLAVAWSWLGVEGRTAVLVGLTLAAAATAAAAGRRGLRAAGESLAAVACGLVVIDTVGVRSSGWVPVSDPGLQVLAGSLLAVLGAVLLATRPRLAVPSLALVGGLLTALLGVVSLPRLDVLPGEGLVVRGPLLAAATLAFLALAARAHRDLARPDGQHGQHGASTSAWLRGSALAAGAVTWWALVVVSLDRLDAAGVTVGGLWSGPGWTLLAAAALLAAPAVPVGGAAARTGPRVRSVAAGSAATLATLVVCLPATDDGATRLGLVALLAAAAWTTPTMVRDLPGWTRLPALAAALPLVGVLLALAAEAVVRTATVPADLRLSSAAPVAHPALVLPGLVVLLVLAAREAAERGLGQVGRSVTAPVLALGVAATVALTPVPLTVLVVVLVAAAAVVARLGRGTPPGLGLGVLAVATGLPSVPLLLLATSVSAGLAAHLAVRGRDRVAVLAGELVLAPAVAGAAWSLAAVLGAGPEVAGPVVLVAVALTALVRPRPLLESSAAAVGVAAAAHVVLAVGTPGSLALHLTLGGALVTLQALVHPARRRLAPVGLVLLALATWVRLADLGVTVPEAYTLPSALVLVATGGVRLWRDDSAGTGVLRPGLLLATVPSLLVVLSSDLVSLRALLLGLACLVLVLLGARLRWQAPLLVGAAVGLLLVVAETAPYSAGVPVWVLVGAAGTALTVVGVTWEHRVQQVRRVAGALGRLR